MWSHKILRNKQHLIICREHIRNRVVYTIYARSIYVVIKGVLISLIGIMFIIELIILRGKIHRDLKIVTVLLKILSILLLSFFMIEGINISKLF